jgi:hypothetical protein
MGVVDRFLAKGGTPTSVNIYAGTRPFVRLKFEASWTKTGCGAFGSLGCIGFQHSVRPRFGLSGIELVKAANVWRVEEARVRRVLLRRAIGCTASEKEH